MIEKAKYVHTNLISENWRSLAEFYRKVFGCEIVGPERDLKGREVDEGTDIKGVQLKGVHLKLPGYGDDGPTLEIFTYLPQERPYDKKVNRPGFGHIAFLVENVNEARKEILSAGGSPVGEIVTVQISEGINITWCYVTDPEGNIIELQTRH